MFSGTQIVKKVIGISPLFLVFSCSQSSGETFTRTKSTSCNAVVYPEGEEASDIQVFYELPKSDEAVGDKEAQCSVTLGDSTFKSSSESSYHSRCEVRGLAAGSKIVVGIDKEKKTATVVQSLNWVSLPSQTINCFTEASRFICSGQASLSKKPFFEIGLSTGTKEIWTEGGDFGPRESSEDFFSCIESGDPAVWPKKNYFEVSKVSAGGQGLDWACRFQKGESVYTVSTSDLKTASVSGDQNSEDKNVICQTHESLTSEH